MPVKKNGRENCTKWHVTWKNKWTDVSHLRVFDTEGEARAFERVRLELLKSERKARVTNRKTKGNEKIIINDLFDRHYALALLSPVTKRQSQYHMAHIRKVFGGRQVRLLTPADLLEFVEEQVARGLARSTINRRISILRSAINWARNVGLLSSNPLSDLRLPRAQPSRLTPPTPFECMKILKHASPHVQRVVFLGLYTGARIGPCELFRLTWDDVDFKAGVIHMPSAKKGARIERRSIPIRKELLAHLKAWKVEDLKKNCRFVIHWGRKPIKSISGGWGAALKKPE